MTVPLRILVMAHGHPDLIRGGGEIAAHQCFQTYQAHDQVEKAWFLAATDTGRGAMGRMKLHGPDEYLWEQGLSDVFMMRAANLHEVTGYFAELLRSLKPTVVHSHHYFKFGLEYLKVIKDVDPNIRTVLTLHEYFAICPNAGQMRNPVTDELCASGAYQTHHACASDQSTDALWLRFKRFQNYFAFVDHFIAPSEFLRQRYIEWGLAPERISTVHNGQPTVTVAPDAPIDRPRNRFAFFGQISAHKGLDVLLEALHSLKDRSHVSLEVHGANLEFQPAEFRKRIKRLSKDLIADGTLQWMGRYAPENLPDRMGQIDWVCVPSLWYENAPLVIQEAYAHGRPVLATGIGGMKEMVSNDIDGMWLPRGNAAAWGQMMQDLAADPDVWTRLHRGITPPVSLAESGERLLDLFAKLARNTS